MLQKPSEQLMRERGAVLEKEGAEVNLPHLSVDFKDRKLVVQKELYQTL